MYDTCDNKSDLSFHGSLMTPCHVIMTFILRTCDLCNIQAYYN